MKPKSNYLELIIRYALIGILAISNLAVFYTIFTPITIYPVFFFLKIFFNATLVLPNFIQFNDLIVQIIPACVAGAAYYFLVALNLATPMNVRKRIYSILFLVLAFLSLNVIRIIVFAFLASNGFQYFDLAHNVTWYFGSTLLLVIIWFVNVSMFKIKAIPVYSDFKMIINDAGTPRTHRRL